MAEQSIGDKMVRKEELSLELVGCAVELQAFFYFL